MFVQIGELRVNPSNVTFVRVEQAHGDARVTIHFVSGEFIRITEGWTIESVMSILEKEFDRDYER